MNRTHQHAHISSICGALQGTKAKILETRKTVPGLRVLDKWAVLAGGMLSHPPVCDLPTFIAYLMHQRQSMHCGLSSSSSMHQAGLPREHDAVCMQSCANEVTSCACFGGIES